MVQTLRRPLLVFTAVALVGAVASSAALAAPGHGRLGPRTVEFRGMGGGGLGIVVRDFGGPGGGAFFGRLGGPGLAGGLLGGPRGGGGGGPAGVLTADVLTPAASFLGITPATLQADLKSGKTLADEATAKGKTAADLVDAIVAAQKTVLDAENAAGWITDAQETSLLSGFKTQVTKLVNTGPPVPPTSKAGPLQTAADYLGISVSQLQSDLRSGKTLADEATANGKTVDGLVTALTADAKTKLDAAVAAGTITAAQEQTMLSDLKDRVTNLVNNAKPQKTAAGMATKLQALIKRV